MLIGTLVGAVGVFATSVIINDITTLIVSVAHTYRQDTDMKPPCLICVAQRASKYKDCHGRKLD